MNNSDKFCFKWDDFSENMRLTLTEVRNRSDFTDVTLVCEDGTQIEAHKLVLAGGSNLFRNILRLKKGPSFILYMKGMKGNQLESVIHFLYNGEVDIDQDDLNDFLTNSEELQLKGLVGLQESEFGKETRILDNCVDKKINTKTKENKHEIKIPTITKSESYEEVSETTVNLKKIKVAGIEDIDIKAREMIDTTGKNWKCTICGKEAMSQDAKGQLKRHTQVHMEGISYPCNLCGREYKYKNKLKFHQIKIHGK